MTAVLMLAREKLEACCEEAKRLDMQAWLYDENGDVSDWQILVTLTPVTKEEFDNFHLNQRGFIKSQTAETILEGRYLYKYVTDSEGSKNYGIAEYSDEYGCTVYLRAKTNIDTEIAKEMFDTAKITKEK